MTKSNKIIAGLGVVAALGAAFIPLTSYAATEVGGEVELSVAVDKAIAMTITSSGDNGTTYLNSLGDASDFDITGTPFGVSSASVALTGGNFSDDMESTVTVYTNIGTGNYALSVKDADNDTSLVNISADSDPIKVLNVAEDGENFTKDQEKYKSLEDSAWGYKVDGGSYKAMTAVGEEIAKSKASGEATKITYGVYVDEEQADGIYTDTIVYTATAK